MLVFIGLGSNLDNPREQINTALSALGGAKGIEVVNSSSFYRSKPLLNMPGPDYLNIVCKINTSLDALELLDLCQHIENKQHRVRDVRWGSRTIDLDILLFGDAIYKNERLTIPHSEMINRSFVLLPLYEIEPTLELPIFGPLKRCMEQLELSDIEKI
ncbi:MAG: 2-amino-4-hydroxy-6-hydroxymethyldihydropteridine diphosphokinase [Gammaproteobacteria bacterium]|nr:2-amino-4-hydroxy-6-hydroxymethyldihydropteridine diphosphokinase [Gammaproteobacteria bacterium]